MWITNQAELISSSAEKEIGSFIRRMQFWQTGLTMEFTTQTIELVLQMLYYPLNG